MSVEATPDGRSPTPAWDHTQCTGTEGCPPRCPLFVDGTGTRVLVRPYVEDWYERLVSFYEDYPREHQSMALPPIARPQVEQWLQRLLDRGKNLLAFDGDTLVGHVAYSPREASESELVVFVDDAYHDRGIGTELCRHAIAHAAADGHAAMRLHVGVCNRRAIHVYRHLGFREVADDDTLVMRLSIDESVAATVQAPPAERYGEGR